MIVSRCKDRATQHELVPVVAGAVAEKETGFRGRIRIGPDIGQALCPIRLIDLQNGAGLPQLMRRPDRGGVLGDIEMEYPAAVVAEDHEHVEQAEGDCMHDEEVAGQDLLDMILQEGSPVLGWIGRSFRLVLGNGPSGHREAELGKFVADASAAPGGILRPQGPDQLPHVLAHRRSSRLVRFPAPVDPEALPMPAEDGVGLEDDEPVPPAMVQSAQATPEEAVPSTGNGFLRSRRHMSSCWRRARFSSTSSRRSPNNALAARPSTNSRILSTLQPP